MGLLAFKVTFDRKEKAYFAGEIVNGKVLIELDKEKAVKGKTLNIGIGRQIYMSKAFKIIVFVVLCRSSAAIGWNRKGFLWFLSVFF